MALVQASQYLRRTVRADDWPCKQLWQDRDSNMLYWDLNYLHLWLSENHGIEPRRSKWIQRYFKPCLEAAAVLNLSHLHCTREEVVAGRFNENAATSQAICVYLFHSKCRADDPKSAAFNQLLASICQRCVHDLQHEEVVVLPRDCSLIVDRSGQVGGLSPFLAAVHGNIELSMRNCWNILKDQGVLQGAWEKNCAVAVRDIALFVANFPRLKAKAHRGTPLQKQCVETLANALVPWLGFHFDRCMVATATDAAPPALRREARLGKQSHTRVAPEAASLSEFETCVCMLAPQMISVCIVRLP